MSRLGLSSFYSQSMLLMQRANFVFKDNANYESPKAKSMISVSKSTQCILKSSSTQSVQRTSENSATSTFFSRKDSPSHHSREQIKCHK